MYCRHYHNMACSTNTDQNTAGIGDRAVLESSTGAVEVWVSCPILRSIHSTALEQLHQ